MTGRATVVAMLIAVRLLAPICDVEKSAEGWAPSYVRCRVCPERTWIAVINEWEYSDYSAEVVDKCGLTHYHNTGKKGATYHCVRCCREWTTEEFTGGQCWCGWDPAEGEVFVDVCGDLPRSQ